MAFGTQDGGLAAALGPDVALTLGGPRRTAHQYVREALRQGILRGTLQGGTRLVQSEIAERLGVSTTPVREALRDLATEGLVQLDAHRGGTVSQLTFEDLLDIHQLSRLVEPEAMRQVATTASRAVVDRARELAERMRTETDSALWAELNQDFHRQLLDATPSVRLRNLLISLSGNLAPYVAMALRSQGREQFEMANEQHLLILEAIAAGDSERCAELTRTHLDLTLRVLDDAREHIV
ncbi:GntR family transcriptional regulator [Qaidamihabitans albus]|uniref:GntR family transcriptional regulator n=1 Tax=Qaidamihabitans albus TaxID=2795733 RepID=UPI0018F155D8|nr:GntR family transcriptional regulator [Qaidamihabitans albus]